MEDLDDGIAGGDAVGEDGFHVNNGVEYRDDVGEPTNTVDDDRPDYCAGDVDCGMLCFFSHVDNCVDAGQGEGRSEKAETEAYPVAWPATGIDKRRPDCPVIGLIAGD